MGDSLCLLSAALAGYTNFTIPQIGLNFSLLDNDIWTSDFRDFEISGPEPNAGSAGP